MYSWMLAQQGLNSLYSKGRFQLTCCECPKWVTAVNSIGTICCPLGHFWTAAWLQCLLLTGNTACSDSVSEVDTGEGKGTRRGEKALMSPLTGDWQLWIFPSMMLETKFEDVETLNLHCHILFNMSFIIFLMKLGWGFILKLCADVEMCGPWATTSSPLVFKHIGSIFQARKWIFPLL